MSHLLFGCIGKPRNVPKRVMHVQSCCFGQVRLRANARNIVGCYMLCLFAHLVACCWMLLRVVAQSLKSIQLFSHNSQHFFCSVIVEAQRNNVLSVCTALSTSLGSHTLITHGLQRLMGRILPTMHCRSQTC